MRDDVHAIEKHCLDRVLPRPERQRVVAQRPEVRIQHQDRPTALRDMCVQVTLLASIYAAKQHVLTYYMQRDGIVKPVERLIPVLAHQPDERFTQKSRRYWGTMRGVAHCDIRR